MNTLRAYLAVLRASFMVGVIYRFSFIFTIIGNLVYMAVTYYLWRSIYANTEVLRGMTFNETYLYVALGSAIFVLFKTYADWLISYEIREGAIASYLIKPIDYQFYTLADSLGSVLMNMAAITLPTLILIIFVFHIPIQWGPGLILFPISLVLAYLINFSFDYFIGITGFYSESIWGISTTKDVIISVLSGALIPLQFYPEAVQKILMVLPFQAMYHTPLMLVSNPNQEWGALLKMLAVQVVWVVATFIFTRLYYNKAIKVLRVAGG
jgi:ABC-2 type transport system permease protein